MVESQPKELKPVYAAARFIVSFVILFYGFAKLNGSQFTILASELDKPMGSVSGFWLTWYYFGYSPVYGNFIALVQILAGVLLMFRRTTLLGACLLFPVITNIILIDIVYGIDLGGNKKSISIWEKWLEKGGKVFDGNYELSGDQMRLSGRFAGSNEETVLFLKKRNHTAGS